jgi:hypothetical protein
MKLSEDTQVNLPAKNLIAIIASAVMAAWFGFGVIERLNSIETQLQLIEKDIEAANEFIAGVPKGEMVSPQIQELYMLTEFLAGDVEKLKEIIENNVPNIEKNEMTIQFHEDRIIDIEDRKNGTH